MTKRIYVGSIPWSASEDELRKLFELLGPAKGLYWPTDRYTGQFRGFAFVAMEYSNANRAIAELNGAAFGGRRLMVDEAL